MSGHWDTRDTRRRLLHLRDAAGADAVAVFTPTLVGDRCHAAFQTGVGDDALVDALRRVDDAPLPFPDGGSPAAVGPDPLNLPPIWMLRLREDAFTEVEATWSPSGFPHPVLRLPGAVAPTLWATCVLSSGHLGAAIALVRRASGRGFSRRARRHANAALHEVAPHLRPPPPAPAAAGEQTLLCDVSGQVLASTDQATDRLAGVLSLIREHAIAYARGPEGHGRAHVLTAAGRLSFKRLNGGAIDRVLVEVEPARLFFARPLLALTARQREIATYAATGATAPQIGDALALSRNTVKGHLKSIYSRLAVTSRSELRDLLER